MLVEVLENRNPGCCAVTLWVFMVVSLGLRVVYESATTILVEGLICVEYVWFIGVHTKNDVVVY